MGLYAFDWSGGNRWCGMRDRCERVGAGFFFSTALIRGWPAVFTSAARSGKWLARDRKWLLMRGGVICSRLPER